MGRSLHSLSQRRRKGRSCFPSPDGPVKKKEVRDVVPKSKRRACGCGCVALHLGHSAGNRFLLLFQMFHIGFVLCCHQQEQVHLRCIGEGKSDHVL